MTLARKTCLKVVAKWRNQDDLWLEAASCCPHLAFAVAPSQPAVREPVIPVFHIRIHKRGLKARNAQPRI